MKQKYELKRRNIGRRTNERSTYDDTTYFAQYSNNPVQSQNFGYGESISPQSQKLRLLSAGSVPIYEDEQCLPMTCYQAKQLQLLKPRKNSIISEENVKMAMKIDKIKAV